ncbi:FtsX-like permease family protein [Kitasatospora sp. NPDC059571]|uniref:FtsX-like permease family protein n=1 Tax=Kitasatospora sp. NPDC059571 TaxID=3346871 RepID=UPI0036BCE3B5
MFVAWRDLRFAKGRFALMGTVVVLITVLVGLLSGLTAGLARGNVSAVTGLPADHLAFAAPADGQKLAFGDSVLPESAWRQWAQVPGVTAAEPLGVATTRARSGGRTAAVSAFGVAAGSPLAPAAVRDGAAVLSAAAAKALGAGPGDRVALGGRELAVTAVAGDAAYSHTPVVWTGLGDWQQIAPGAAGGGTRATVVALTTRPGADLRAADARLGTRTVTREGALAAIGSYTSENGSLQLMRGFLFAISALVVGAFFTVWTIQRSGDVAVLKALGASTGYLLRDALGQAVLLLVAGTAAGSALAAAAGALVSGTVPFVLDASTVLVPALVMTALGAAGAALSVRRITSVDPLTALGSTR